MSVRQTRALVLSASIAFAVPALAVDPILNEDIDERGLYVEASADSDFGSDYQQVEYFATDSSDIRFLPWSASDNLMAQSQSAIGRGRGSITTTIDATAFLASASVFGSGQILDETGYNASGGSTAQMRIGFTLLEATTWRLAAEFAINGNGLGFVRVLDGFAANAPALHDWTVPSGTLVLDETITLAPGQYQLSLYLRANVSNFSDPLHSANASFQSSFSVVPGSATVALLGFGGLATTRRRRVK